MQLTTEERATIYCMMLAEIDNRLFEYSTRKGFCLMLKSIFRSELYCDPFDLADLPELCAQRPPLNSVFWFTKGRWDERKKCLIEALKLCNI